jgi:hypothetical protein
MSIKLLPASVNLVDSSQAPEASTSLVPLSQKAITARASQISLAPSADSLAWSSSPRRGGANLIHGMLVEDSQGDGPGRSGWEYVSGWAGSRTVGSTAVAHYLSYATDRAGWRGRLIDLYA